MRLDAQTQTCQHSSVSDSDAQGSKDKAKAGLMLGIFELEAATSALVGKTIRTKAALG